MYPVSAKQAGLQGKVEIENYYSKATRLNFGISLQTTIFRNRRLKRYARWRYRPTLLNGAPVEIATDITVNYTLANRWSVSDIDLQVRPRLEVKNSAAEGERHGVGAVLGSELAQNALHVRFGGAGGGT